MCLGDVATVAVDRLHLIGHGWAGERLRAAKMTCDLKCECDELMPRTAA